MSGYCSNSLLRCDNARLMIKLYQTDNYCPKCGLSLVVADNLSESSRAEQYFLILCLVLIAILLLAVTYIYYLNLV